MHSVKLLSVFFTFIVLITSCLSSFAQQGDFSSQFNEAVKLSEENEQNQASQLWARLAKDYPDNGNVNYRAGLSQLETGQSSAAALPFLLSAKEAGISKNYDRYSAQEKQAPVELHYYLGKVYHLNYMLEKAKLSYLDFVKEAGAKHYLRKNAELGIRQCTNAQKLMENPVEFEITNMGEIINSEYDEFSPVISVDENALFFTSTRVRPDSSNLGVRDRITGDYFNDIYVSYRNRSGNWQTPELLEINEPEHTATVGVNADGQKLYVYRDDNGVGNIYESTLVGELWSDIEKMGGGINSDAWETHIAVSVDEEVAYFVSNRSGGIGGRDIYRVRKLPNGRWSDAQNLGPTINTPYEEDAAFLSTDGKTLYFSSEGHNSMGGFDIFYSDLDDETMEWGPPTNIGYPINGTDDDVFFVTSADERRAYFSSIRDDGFGEKDIYMVELPGDRDTRLALLTGKIFTSDNSPIPAGLSIAVTNKNTGGADVYTPRSRDGGFVAILPPCNPYLVEYMSGGLVLATDTFSIDCESAYQEIRKELVLRPMRILPDGTAEIVRDDVPELLISSTTADVQPATFKRYFGYNENIVALEEELFTQFMKQLKKLSEARATVKIEVVGSASKVPTRTHGSNQKLAQLRADNAVKRIRLKCGELGINPDKIEFTKVEAKVDGLAYRGDFKEKEQQYRSFQYIDITAK